MNNQTSPHELIKLVDEYKKIVINLNTSIDVATQKNNELAIAKAEVAKNKHLKELIEEQIKCEKKIIDAGRN